MYNLEHLRMLVWSTEEGSFSACARKLGKAQSAVSQGISNLEIDIGIQLFDRTTRKPTLTEDGKRIYAYAKSVLALTGELDSVVKAIQNEEEPNLRLAFDNALFTHKLSSILGAFSRQFPKTQIELLSVPCSDIAELVVNRQAEIGIMFTTPPLIQELEYCYIGSQPFCAVCHPESALLLNEKVSISQLVNHRQLYLRGISGEGLMHLPKISPDIWYCNGFDTTVKLVEENLGWAFLPLHMANKAITNGNLATFNFELDDKPWMMPVDLVTHKGIKKGVAFQWLFDRLKSLV
ncbi:LysR family transcriptional regulator [Photobacterium proteolyticum]|nr:LysR family transcriptional regulator [Photobacterium proteolyticum]